MTVETDHHQENLTITQNEQRNQEKNKYPFVTHQ